MDALVFDFHEYKQYLTKVLGGFRERKGQRLALSKTLGCQPTFVSQVLNGNAHFSLEQAEKVSRFLGHSDEERDYFFLLLQKERAGTEELRRYHDQKIRDLLAKRQVLVHRLGKDKALSREDQAIYYSSWHFAAIHIALTIPGLRTRESLAEYFRLPLGKVSEVLEHLTRMGIVVHHGEHFEVSEARVRLGRDSHNLLKHHANWRGQAVDALDREDGFDLHYSAVISLSEADRIKIKDMILDALKAQLEVTDQSKEEVLYAYCIDFFSLRR